MSQNQALSGVLFLYRDVLHIEIGSIENVPRARTPIHVPVVLSRDEVARIMKHVDGVAWIIVALLYGAGLRLQECLELRVKDIDLERHQADLARGFGRVVLPFALDRKYPNAPTEWAWQFVFPASRVCTDPKWGPPTRFHLHESVVRKAVRTRRGRRALPNVWVRTLSGIRLRPICSRTATTFERCKSCSVTRT